MINNLAATFYDISLIELQLNVNIFINHSELTLTPTNTYATMNHHYNSNLNSNSMEICTSSGVEGGAPSSLTFSNIIEGDWQIVTPKYRSL
ncbi:hypothetical protein HCN44_010941 [Aphidius gifuensis]|uniref:Uncharacterized protein n=1 Tax=Aphidius gifuensis TaxID=684658 RepID=A0A834Y3A3_APHGI|nr:hypothetical protein HCN44_010941 [Aphidius gifuensis]